MSRPGSRAVTAAARLAASRADVDRLGRRGSYRLGSLGPPGAGRVVPPRPFRPMFVRQQHRGSAAAWVLAALAATALIAGSAAIGLWFMPFAVGLVTGVMMRWGGLRLRVAVPATAIMAGAGWGLALWASALRGLPVGPTARTIAVIAGLPVAAFLTIAITLGVSVMLGLSGLWLGRAVAPRPGRD